MNAQPVVVVTGGASGIGMASARSFTSRGYTVVLADLDEGLAAEKRDELASAGGHVLSTMVDVASDSSVSELVDHVTHHLGRLDVLVNSAGYAERCPSESLESGSWDRMLGVHLGGTFRCAREFFPLLSASPQASIVNVSSISAHVGRPMRAHYAASKAGIEGITRTLAVEWAPRGIRVNTVAPGHVYTEMLIKAEARGVFRSDEPIARIPLGRLGRPEEIAAVVVFLGTPDSSFVTGQVLVADGGMTVNGRFD